MGPETSHVLSQAACLFGAHVHKNTNGRVIYTALYVMILMRANPLLGPLEGPEHLDFLGPFPWP